jgi:hypothetical protein
MENKNDMISPKKILFSGTYTIKFYDETDYSSNTSNLANDYEKKFSSSESYLGATGIKLFENDQLISSCIIQASGLTGIFENSILINDDEIVICCGNTVFKLSIPDLNLEWRIIADTCSCFAIYPLNQDYIIHGELEITRLDSRGNILWQNSGRDIWVTPESDEAFMIYNDHILATDWDYYRYKFDFDGKLLDEYRIDINKIKPKKNWWKFW